MSNVAVFVEGDYRAGWQKGLWNRKKKITVICDDSLGKLFEHNTAACSGRTYRINISLYERLGLRNLARNRYTNDRVAKFNGILRYKLA